MRSSTGLYIGVIALTAGYFLWRKGGAAGSLVFFPGNITGMAFQGAVPTISFELYVQNTNGSDLRLNSLAGNLSSNGTLIGNVGNFDGLTIPGNSQVVVPLTVMLQPIGIVTDLIRSFQYKNFQQKVELAAQANVNNVQIPVNVSFTVGS